MQKIMLAPFLLLICCISGYCQKAIANSFDVRQVRWGMSKAQVIKSEAGSKSLRVGSSILFSGIKIAKCNAVIEYSFIEDKLHEVIYHIEADTDADFLYYYDFRDVQNRLEEKYGDKPKGGWIWHKETYKDNPDKYGLAIKYSDLAILWEWINSRSSIVHAIMGRDFKVSHTITFTQLPTDDF